MTLTEHSTRMDGAYLEIKTPAGQAKYTIAKDATTIGRHSDNLLKLAEPMASRFHCVIEKVKEGYRVRDLDSRNGTRLNGQPIKVALLIPGDVVTIGGTELTFMTPGATPQKKAAPAKSRSNDDSRIEVALDGHEDDEDPLENIKVGPGADEAEYRRYMTKLAESLPDRTFNDADIVLINARGKVQHAGQRADSRRNLSEQGQAAVDLFRLILLISFRTRATDIHLEPKKEDYSVRIRVDGNMTDVIRLNSDIGVRVNSLVKVLSDIDIAQKNIVQEGHFSTQVPGRRVDYRVSFTPAMFGQKLVIRILDAANAPLHIKDLEMPTWMSEELRKAIEQEAGMILTCGPTGSGKTTTLYALLRDLDTNQRNVVTIEDPVEIQIEGVTQIPVNDEQGNTFPALLKSVLRQDPDGILVGEIRDAETARIAMQASMTGHLVFSTVHARDTIGVIFRLIDLGVEPYLVASGLQLVVAQRLVRQLCPFCKRSATPTPEQLAKLGAAGQNVSKIYYPQGCQRCLKTGHAGRRALFELLATNEQLREVLLKNPSMGDIQKTLGPRFQKLAVSGYSLVAEGICSIDEIERAVGLG